MSNVLNGTVKASPATVSYGTVARLVIRLGQGPPQLVNSAVVANGFAERTDPAALVVGPTGLAIGNLGQLYVADTVNSRIAVVPFAVWRWTPQTGGGITLTSGGALNGPLGLTLAPNNDVLTVTRVTEISSRPLRSVDRSMRSPSTRPRSVGTSSV